MKANQVAKIVEASIVGDGVVDKLLYKDPATDEPIAFEKDIPFYSLQKRLVLAMNGKVEPLLHRRLPLARRLPRPGQGARRR